MQISFIHLLLSVTFYRRHSKDVWSGSRFITPPFHPSRVSHVRKSRPPSSSHEARGWRGVQCLLPKSKIFPQVPPPLKFPHRFNVYHWNRWLSSFFFIARSERVLKIENLCTDIAKKLRNFRRSAPAPAPRFTRLPPTYSSWLRGCFTSIFVRLLSH